MKKLCGKCLELKTLDNFSKDKTKNDGLTRYCKTCVSKYQRQRYEDTKETRRKQYVKGIGYVNAKEESRQNLIMIRYRFKQWVANGGEFK